jgi:GNAT superfamily N-acetyltransferase
MRIREAQPEDAVLLSALAQESKAHWGYAPELLEVWRRELTIAPGDIRMYPTFVAEVPVAVAGFYQLRRGVSFWTLEHLWVRPSRLRRGIGSMLLNHALDRARHSGLTRVVASADPNAAGFYEHEGGLRTGVALAPVPGDPTRALPVYEFQWR